MIREIQIMWDLDKIQFFLLRMNLLFVFCLVGLCMT